MIIQEQNNLRPTEGCARNFMSPLGPKKLRLGEKDPTIAIKQNSLDFFLDHSDFRMVCLLLFVQDGLLLFVLLLFLALGWHSVGLNA